MHAGSRVVMVDRDEGSTHSTLHKHGNAVLPNGHRPTRPACRLRNACRGSWIVSRPTRHPACKRGHSLCRRRLGGRRHGGYRPDAELECQRRDQERPRRAALHMIERRTGDIIVTSSLAAIFQRRGSRSMRRQSERSIALSRRCATPSLQARHSRGHDLTLPRHQRTPCGLAAREIERSQRVLEVSRRPAKWRTCDHIFTLTRPRGMTIRDVSYAVPLILIFRADFAQATCGKARSKVSADANIEADASASETAASPNCDFHRRDPHDGRGSAAVRCRAANYRPFPYGVAMRSQGGEGRGFATLEVHGFPPFPARVSKATTPCFSSNAHE